MLFRERLVTFDPKVTVRPILSFPGYYAGEDGSIWSKKTQVGKRDKRALRQEGFSWLRLKQSLRSRRSKYLSVCICRDGIPVNVCVHFLILLAFAGERPNGFVCRHLNGESFDNRAVNLKWGTHQENTDDKVRHGTMPIGERNGSAFLTRQEVLLIRERWGLGGVTKKQIAAVFGVTDVLVGKIIRREIWKHI